MSKSPKDREGMAGQTEPNRSVTVHDVARRAGVSSMTVSRFVNGTKVGDDLQAKVRAAIDELNYVPNLAARAARIGSLRIGVLVSNPNSSNLSEFLIGSFRQSSQDGSQLVVEPIISNRDPLDAVRKLVDLGIDGIILPPPLCDSMEALDIVWRARIPALSFATADPRSHSSAVMIDDFEGARALAHHLLDQGHTDIAFVRGDPGHSPAIRREEGFRAAMAAAGLSPPPGRFVDGLFTYRSGLEAGRRLLNVEQGERPTAIFASNDDTAAAIVAVAHGLGIRIPGELSIAGFDDTPIASLLWPQLTTVRQPIADMAATAVDILATEVRRKRSNGNGAIRHVVLPFELKIRGSSGPPGTPS